jgi:hypothetical protein
MLDFIRYKYRNWYLKARYPYLKLTITQLTEMPGSGGRNGPDGVPCWRTDDSEGVLLSLRQKGELRRRFFRQSGPKKSEPLAGNASKAFLDCVNGAPKRIPLLS